MEVLFIVIVEVTLVLRQASLPSYLSIISSTGSPRLGQGVTVNGDPEAYQGTGGQLNGDISSDNPHAWIETSIRPIGFECVGW